MNTKVNITCPLCGDSVEKLLYRYHITSEEAVVGKIKAHNPGWVENDGICSRCVDYYHTEIIMQQRLLPEVGPYFPVKTADDFIVLPTPLRLDADSNYCGKGITICFIDSGFYPHPDLTKHNNRIKAVIDITNDSKTISAFETHQHAWHGTMTSVVCAGDGYLSNGLYKGIASEANLVLLKVMDSDGRVGTENIVKALKWVLTNYENYNIRIINISLGDDNIVSYKESEIDQLATQLYEKGINIIAAAGNDVNAGIKPPANSPHVITVGGYDDQNNLESSAILYHSTYGQTIDGFMKPELTAQAIWIAAPILPGTKEHIESQTLHTLLETTDECLQAELKKNIAKTLLPESLVSCGDISFIKQNIVDRIQSCKFISPDYMHVDGTSFAAPITSSIIAQLLEINPQLTPIQIRELLFSTAERLQQFPPERQGFGLIKPRKAIVKTLNRKMNMKTQESPFINSQSRTIQFFFQNECASQISLAGSFNHWAKDVLLMQPGENGRWKIEIPMLPAGRYQYKFYLDGRHWQEDFNNPLREPDGFSGFNSILIIEN